MRKFRVLTCILLTLSLAACGAANPALPSSDVNNTQPEVTTLPAESTATDLSAEAVVSYADLADLTFTFSSGVGAWMTTLFIAADGSFEGEFFDEDMGAAGDGYSNGTVSLCTFHGQLAPLSRKDDLTCTTTISSISYAKTADTEEILDNIHYVYTTAYGLDDAETLYFYLPGTKTADLDEECMSWIATYLQDGVEGERPDTIPFTVLYNKNAGTAFVGMVEG